MLIAIGRGDKKKSFSNLPTNFFFSMLVETQLLLRLRFWLKYFENLYLLNHLPGCKTLALICFILYVSILIYAPTYRATLA